MGMKDKHWQVYLAGRMSGISHSDAIGWRYNAEKLFRGVEKYHGCKFTVINPARYYNFKEVKYQDTDIYHTYKMYLEKTEPIIEHYRKQNVLQEVNGEDTIENVFNTIDKIISEK